MIKVKWWFEVSVFSSWVQTWSVGMEIPSNPLSPKKIVPKFLFYYWETPCCSFQRQWERWWNQEIVVYFWHFVLWDFRSAVHFFFPFFSDVWSSLLKEQVFFSWSRKLSYPKEKASWKQRSGFSPR